MKTKIALKTLSILAVAALVISLAPLGAQAGHHKNFSLHVGGGGYGFSYGHGHGHGGGHHTYPVYPVYPKPVHCYPGGYVQHGCHWDYVPPHCDTYPVWY